MRCTGKCSFISSDSPQEAESMRKKSSILISHSRGDRRERRAPRKIVIINKIKIKRIIIKRDFCYLFIILIESNK